MLEYSTIKKIFSAAAELREDYENLREAYGVSDIETRKAWFRYCGAMDILQAIGGAELEDEFLEWYNDRQTDRLKYCKGVYENEKL